MGDEDNKSQDNNAQIVVTSIMNPALVVLDSGQLRW